MRLLKAALLALIGAAGIAFGYWWGHQGNGTSLSGPPLPAVEFLRLGFDALSAPDDKLAQEEKAHFLTQVALRRQADDPRAAGQLWPTLWAYLDPQGASPHKQVSPDDRLQRLLAYRDSLDLAALATNTRGEFDAVWGVRDQVNEKIDAALGDIAKNLEDALSQGVNEDGEVAKRLDKFAQAMERHAGSLEWLRDRTPEKAAQLGKACSGILVDVARYQSDRKDALRKLKASLDDGVQPSDHVEGGECIQLLKGMDKLQIALGASGIDQWLPGEDAAESEQTEGQADAEHQMIQSLAKDAGELIQQAMALQQARYNVWALAQLSAAHTANGWDSILAPIDVGLLHPTVMGLYSQVTAGHLDQLTNPADRSRVIRTLLAPDKKLGLDRF